MCTGIRLKATNNDVIYARTLEWGAFDLQSELTIHPRNESFTSDCSGDIKVLSWQGKYGFIGFDGLGKTNMTLDGVNEKSLGIGVFYHPELCQL